MQACMQAVARPSADYILRSTAAVVYFSSHDFTCLAPLRVPMAFLAMEGEAFVWYVCRLGVVYFILAFACTARGFMPQSDVSQLSLR